MSYFWHITLLVHPKFEFGESLDAEFNFTSNPYPHCTLLRYPRHPKMKISIKKLYFNIKIRFFIEIFMFGFHGYLTSMQCGYGLDAELNSASKESPNSKFGWTHKEICQKYDEKKYFFSFSHHLFLQILPLWLTSSSWILFVLIQLILIIQFLFWGPFFYLKTLLMSVHEW